MANPDEIVFVLQHVAREGADDEDVKMIGVYRSQEAAEEAIRRLLPQPGFAAWPDGFHVDGYELDRDHWTDGFFSD